MHYYQFNIADYRKDTNHLTPMEHYIYRTLLDWYYLDEKPISTETQWVTRRLGLGSDSVPLVDQVLTDFFYEAETEEGPAWFHKRAEQVIDGYYKTCNKNRENGKLGGRPKTKQAQCENNPVGYQSVTSGLPAVTQPEPKLTLTINHKPESISYKPEAINQEESKSNTLVHPASARPRQSDYSEEFNTFWSIYSKYRTEKKKPASDKFTRILKEGVDVEKILTGLRANEPGFSNKDKQFVPHAVTWLNQRRWEDEVTSAALLFDKDIEL